MRGRLLVPTGTAREAMLAGIGDEGTRGRRRAVGGPAFPFELLEGASLWEEGVELLHLAWELARCAPEAPAKQQRALLLLAFVAQVSVREGSTRIPVHGGAGAALLEEVLGRLGASASDRRSVSELVEKVPPQVGSVLGRAGDALPLILDGEWLYVQRLHRSEMRLVDALRVRLGQGPVADEALVRAASVQLRERPSVFGGREVALNDEQERAVHTAACRPLTVVTGGPGTGKTSVVVSILRTLARFGVRPEQVALAAPTGKAAMRMAESVRGALEAVVNPAPEDAQLRATPPEARTLHRLLGYSQSTERFHHHEDNPLAEEVVIVDESSMVDLFLMERLLRSVRPGTRLVLLGDADQLPSVDAGAVFRDLVATGESEGDAQRGAVVRLTRSYRMDPQDPAGRNILTVARAVQAGVPPSPGDGPDETVALRARAAEVRFERMELLACEPGDVEHRAFLERWWEEVLRGDDGLERLVRHEYRFDTGVCADADRADLDALFRRFEAARLLCLTRGASSPSGAEAINAFFHARAVRSAKLGGSLRQAPELLPGEPILVEQNDYGRNLFNGDQGLIIRGVDTGAEGRQHFMAAFRRGDSFVAFPLDGLRHRIRHAYAMTVHKAQGSEFDRVALVLPSRDLPLLTRELLYTGITRARRSVVLVGAPAQLEVGVRRALHRFSGIAERLGSAVPEVGERARTSRGAGAP